MRTVTLGLASIESTSKDLAAAFAGEARGERIDFSSVELLWRVLTAKRLQLVERMAGQGPMAIREAARRVGRDVKAVHGDISALLDAGILDRTSDGRVVFPYDAIHVDFVLSAGADRE